ncbi:MAG: ATP synthase F1 subunit gamma [Butyricicoccus pullicaecorum]|nr:ATP synthase F1 subunit gamma [Butyricicoccus pullicaecorum]
MASGNMKDIKRRIRSVESTMQITKAMELVASSKLRRAKERVEQTRPYFYALQETVSRVLRENHFSNVYTEQRTIKKSLFIVIAGDRGLAGGYNAGVLKLAAAEMEDKQVSVVTIGKKAQEYFAKRDYEVLADYPGVAETLTISDMQPITANLLAQFRAGKIDEIYLCYTAFVSPMTQEPRMVRLLPAAPHDQSVQGKKNGAVECDPSPETVLQAVIPEYISGMIYGAVVESYASEQSARRMAMESASDNASEMIEDLNLSYNRARQAAITQEITEIVAGSGAVGS